MIVANTCHAECTWEFNSECILNIFLPFTLFFDKASKLNNRPNLYVAKTQKFLLSYWQLTFFMWRCNIYNYYYYRFWIIKSSHMRPAIQITMKVKKKKMNEWFKHILPKDMHVTWKWTTKWKFWNCFVSIKHKLGD